MKRTLVGLMLVVSACGLSAQSSGGTFNYERFQTDLDAATISGPGFLDDVLFTAELFEDLLGQTVVPGEVLGTPAMSSGVDRGPCGVVLTRQPELETEGSAVVVYADTGVGFHSAWQSPDARNWARAAIEGVQVGCDSFFSIGENDFQIVEDITQGWQYKEKAIQSAIWQTTVEYSDHTEQLTMFVVVDDDVVSFMKVWDVAFTQADAKAVLERMIKQVNAARGSQVTCVGAGRPTADTERVDCP